jgi:hypothetical protein
MHQIGKKKCTAWERGMHRLGNKKCIRLCYEVLYQIGNKTCINLGRRNVSDKEEKVHHIVKNKYIRMVRKNASDLERGIASVREEK